MSGGSPSRLFAGTPIRPDHQIRSCVNVRLDGFACVYSCCSEAYFSLRKSGLVRLRLSGWLQTWLHKAAPHREGMRGRPTAV